MTVVGFCFPRLRLLFPLSIITTKIGNASVRVLILNIFCHMCYNAYMTKGLTKLQDSILRLAETRDLATMTYREIAGYVGATHPYTVQQAVNSLVAKSMLVKNQKTGEIGGRIYSATRVRKPGRVHRQIFQ